MTRRVHIAKAVLDKYPFLDGQVKLKCNKAERIFSLIEGCIDRRHRIVCMLLGVGASLLRRGPFLARYRGCQTRVERTTCIHFQQGHQDI